MPYQNTSSPKNSSIEGKQEDKMGGSGDYVHRFIELGEQISLGIQLKIYQDFTVTLAVSQIVDLI